MEITLISLCRSVLAYGLRTMSAYLKEHGHQVNLVFLPREGQNFNKHYSDSTLKRLSEICRSSSLVGVSVMTNHLLWAKYITRHLKRDLNIPIVWGGVHPSIMPRECLEDADIVCVGEGEDALLELIEAINSGLRNPKIAGIWYRTATGPINGGPSRMAADLDKYPPPDYELNSQFILDGSKLKPLTADLLHKNLGSSYGVSTTRGCPHCCTYCYNWMFKERADWLRVRRRSISKVIEEVEMIFRRFDFLNTVWLIDETFFVRNLAEIEEFCNQFKSRIGKSFMAEISPLTFSERKLQVCLESGLRELSMGVESASERTNFEIYGRRTTRRKLDSILKCISKYKDRLLICRLDFIVNNPWEDDDSRIETIELVASLPHLFRINYYPLCFFPGTKIYNLAMQEGRIKDMIKDVVLPGFSFQQLRHGSYLDLCLVFLHFVRQFAPRIPHKAIKVLAGVLTSNIVRCVMERSLFRNSFFWTLYLLYTLFKFLKKIRK